MTYPVVVICRYRTGDHGNHGIQYLLYVALAFILSGLQSPLALIPQPLLLVLGERGAGLNQNSRIMKMSSITLPTGASVRISTTPGIARSCANLS